MVKKALIVILAGTVLSGCMGTNAVTAKIRKGNLCVVENRWGREGIFLGLNILWVYRIGLIADLLVFNSIEFWNGESIINGRPALVNMPIEEVRKAFGEDVHMAQVERLNDTEAKMYVCFDNGDRVTFDVSRTNDEYSICYLGQEYYKGKLQLAVL